jgi:hypothetical protein
MKSSRKLLMLLSLILIGIIFGDFGTLRTFAQTTITHSELKITKVSDIEVYNDYEINNISIDNAVYPYYETKIYKFTLSEDGFIKLFLTADKLTKLKTTLTSNTPKYEVQEPVLTATVYRDEKLLYSVIPTITAKGSISAARPSVNGETKDKIALDKGTYYVAIKSDQYQQGNSSTQVRGQAGLILYYQSVISDEYIRPSSVGQENPIELNDTFHGLLTVANPKDYYAFSIKERSLVTIKYMYESTKKAKFVLYGKDRDVQSTKQFVGNNTWNQEELLLEAGKYYVSLETLTTGDGGRTSLSIIPTPYLTELTLKNRSQNSYIEVETIEAPREVRYLKGKLTQKDINNAKWKNASLITEQLQFGVNSKGYYSIRVVDDNGNMVIDNIRVAACDSTAPAKPKITGYGTGSYEVVGTAEKNSIVTVIYNNRQYIGEADSKGKYSVILAAPLRTRAKVEVFATDISGNASKNAVVVVK